MQHANPQQIDAIRRNTDAFMALSNLAIASAERLTALNLDAMRGALEEAASASDKIRKADASNLPATVKSVSKDLTSSSAMSYFQGLVELTTETQQELVKQMTAYLESQGKHSPLGKGWFNGFEAFGKLTDQMKAITEANHKTMADAGAKMAAATTSHTTHKA